MKGQIPESMIKAWELEHKRLEETLPENQKNAAKAIAAKSNTGESPEQLCDWLYNIGFSDYLFNLLPDEPFPEYLRDRRCLRKPHEWAWKFAYLDDVKINVFIYVHGKIPAHSHREPILVSKELVATLCRI